MVLNAKEYVSLMMIINYLFISKIKLQLELKNRKMVDSLSF